MWRMTIRLALIFDLSTLVATLIYSSRCSSKIEVAYQEAVALKRQEELIREEAAWIAETERKLKRCVADKEKKSKKKQV